MENNLVLTMKEQKPVCQSTGRRIEIIERVFWEEITMVEAAMVLGVSVLSLVAASTSRTRWQGARWRQF